MRLTPVTILIYASSSHHPVTIMVTGSRHGQRPCTKTERVKFGICRAGVWKLKGEARLHISTAYSIDVLFQSSHHFIMQQIPVTIQSPPWWLDIYVHLSMNFESFLIFWIWKTPDLFIYLSLYRYIHKIVFEFWNLKLSLFIFLFFIFSINIYTVLVWVPPWTTISHSVIDIY